MSSFPVSSSPTSSAAACVGLLALAALSLGSASAPFAAAAPAENLRTVAREAAWNPGAPVAAAEDPRAYLEQVEDERSLAWVRAQNERSLGVLSADPRFEAGRAAMLAILEAKDRIPSPDFARGGFIDNFWQDPEHVRGILRRSDRESYLAGEPKWETLLDLDALAKAEGKNWVYKGHEALPTDESRALVYLSDGGKDAVTIREYDLAARAFVVGGFELPEGKQTVSWKDRDTLYVAREWTPGEMTASGYAYVAKVLKRGQSLAEAVEVFRGEKTDMAAFRVVLRDIDGGEVVDMGMRRRSFFETETTWFTDAGPRVLPLPLSTDINGYFQGQLVCSLKEPWKSAKGTAYPSGAIVAFDLKQAFRGPEAVEPRVIFLPNAHQSVDNIAFTRNRLLLSVLEDVTGRVLSARVDQGEWVLDRLSLPENSTLGVDSTDTESDAFFVWSTGFLQPNSLYLADAANGAVSLLRASPDRFDTSGLQVSQRWATSKDGTRVPYFLVRRADAKEDGATPTLLTAYGGFEIALKPAYSAGVGKLWLEKGGAYAVACIRGGGEFGPEWHKAGLKTKRQVVYDDFQAVAEDLIATGLTSPRRLGIMGGSNGGLLMGVQLTQRPDLWNALVVRVPLLDMLRYHRLLAGASWMGEYGSPDDPAEAAFLRKISPYHNLRAGVAYPEPLFVTSTKDDRVHPGHARKMAALMEDMGLPFLYYENTDGGHSAAANLKETAKRSALEFTYLARKLMD